MKEASGELSMTAVAVVAIGAVAVVFTTLVWPSLKANITRNSYCSQAYNCGTPDSKGKALCYYLDENNSEKSVVCTMDDAD